MPQKYFNIQYIERKSGAKLSQNQAFAQFQFHLLHYKIPHLYANTHFNNKYLFTASGMTLINAMKNALGDMIDPVSLQAMEVSAECRPN